MTDEITKCLLKHARSTPSDIVIPNWYSGHWEMDVFKMTKSGVVTEYEVKVSVSDFKNDFKKSDYSGKLKHDYLENRCNQFYFVVPAGLISKNEVPDQCGLMYFENGHFSVVKMPKKNKVYIFTNWKDLAYKMYYRCDNLRHKLFLERRKKKNRH